MGETFAIAQYHDADRIIKQLDNLIQQPIYTSVRINSKIMWRIILTKNAPNQRR